LLRGAALKQPKRPPSQPLPADYFHCAGKVAAPLVIWHFLL
jgi:hypothetical protein